LFGKCLYFKRHETQHGQGEYLYKEKTIVIVNVNFMLLYYIMKIE